MGPVFFWPPNGKMTVKPNRNTTFQIIVIVSAVLYAIIMLKLLLFRGHSLGKHLYNLYPFWTIHHLLADSQKYTWQEWYKNLFGNIVLFVPLGIYLPLWNKRLWHAGRLALAVIALIFVVESLQLLAMVGTFDVDDIILNTFGAEIGLLFMYILRSFRRSGKLQL